MGVDSSNSLTALYHERWLMTGRKPDKIITPTVFNPFFPVFFSRSAASTGRWRGTGGAVPALCGHGAKARGRGQA
jgi:hypothetical protein